MEHIIYTGDKPKLEISDVFRDTLEDLINTDSNVVYVDADLMGSMKTSSLWKKYPKNVINTGIQEANMVGIAAGYSLIGLKPYIHTFAPFASRRVFDQVFLSIGYAKKSVRIIGSDAGICATYNGGTHMCFEDIAIMRTVPNACIIDVSDAHMFAQLLRITKDRNGLTYFRTARRDVPDIYSEEVEFEIGKGKIIKEGIDVTIIASGILVATALQAANKLELQGIKAKVVDLITIKPIDKELVISCAKETGAIVTAENHNIIGGLGSAVSELLSEEYPVPVLKIGVEDRYGQVGSDMFLREQYGLTIEKIIEKAKIAISKKLGETYGKY